MEVPAWLNYTAVCRFRPTETASGCCTLTALAPTKPPNGELGFYPTSDGANCPSRARCRPPSFINYQVFEKLLVGHQISDLVAVLGRLNIFAAELDQ